MKSGSRNKYLGYYSHFGNFNCMGGCLGTGNGVDVGLTGFDRRSNGNGNSVGLVRNLSSARS